MTEELTSNAGVSALGGTLLRMARALDGRARPQQEFGTITMDLALMPDSWGAEPFSFGRYSVANHLELHVGDRVTLAWLSGRPMVEDLVGMADSDERNADHTRRRVTETERRLDDHEQRIAALEAALAAHLAGHA